MSFGCLTNEMASLASFIKAEAKALGFDACGIAAIEPIEEERMRFNQWLSADAHADMQYMANHPELRFNPSGLIEGARSIISVALNYYPAQRLPEEAPHIAYYAYGKDYHVVVKEKLRLLWQRITMHYPSLCPGEALPEARVFTDSAPLLERYWAWKAGLGWIGKNTQLILPGKGSYFFLGEIVTTLDLSADRPVENRCGSCTRCLQSCPTKAL